VGLILAVSRMYLPQPIRNDRLGKLFLVTADAFQSLAPSFRGYSYHEMLDRYAHFTREKAEESIRRGNEDEVKERLYFNARRIGQNIRRELGVRTLAEVMQACRVIYRALKIEFRGDSQGQVYIPTCFFSSYYSSEVCRLISSLDQGLVAGLSGDLRMEFTQRITEGAECCRANLQQTGIPS
jgi:hypothetical protein